MPDNDTIEQIVKRDGVVHTVDPRQDIAAAAAIMMRHGVGCLVVVGPDGAVAGILTERDILREVVAQAIDPNCVLVANVMTRKVVTCTMQTEVRQAEKMMARHGTRHLPILDDGRLLGMVSSRDIMAHQLSATRTLVRRQTQVLQDLESSHPGITHLQTDDGGRICII